MQLQGRPGISGADQGGRFTIPRIAAVRQDTDVSIPVDGRGMENAMIERS